MNDQSPRRPSIMTDRFANVPQVDIERSTFDRSHPVKTTLEADKLVPFFVDEVLPGDTFNLEATSFIRMPTLLDPIMDNLHFDTFFFFVPNRLVWDNWQKFMGERENPQDSIDFVVPTLDFPITPIAIESIYDYMGLPAGNIAIPGINALYFRAYNLIWNEWFRDQNLQDSLTVPTGDGPDASTNYTIQKRGKRHDYFTSCLPWPQKGEAIRLPLGTRADVKGIGPIIDPEGTPPSGQENFGVNPQNLTRANIVTPQTQRFSFRESGTGVRQVEDFTVAPLVNFNRFINLDESTFPHDETIFDLGSSANSAGVGIIMEHPDPSTSDHLGPNIYADLSAATAITINDLREAFQIQKFLERDARGGTRYTEIIRSHFGVTSPDARLQRPEYLGGGSDQFDVNVVAQTSTSSWQRTDSRVNFDAATPQGNLSAFGQMTAHNHGFSKAFTEHGMIIGLMNIRADLTYSQGIERMFLRKTRYDYYFPVFAHLGEQVVQNKELCYLDQNDPSVTDNERTLRQQYNEGVFGYQERHAEYRYKPGHLTGHMRVDSPLSLSSWHLSQDFDRSTVGDAPALNDDFIQSDTPINRISAIADDTRFIYDGWISLKTSRPMPVYGVPGFTDHF